ncbi:MAG: TIGR04211 family SH3 domain-containing protein [Rheinheimera sp.]|jgi:SH3 domain protein|nr:TIGR04211 family SH3 domain-containing protein [Gammaproteobacteria bacterium]MDZ7902391.1 TIGR04211 family SH3 domain-containing protein [Rheinheimera sp.]
MSNLIRPWLLVASLASAVSVAQTSPATTPAGATPASTEPAKVSASSEKPAFVIDALSTPLRSGPGNEYRTISTVRAGESVTFIGDNPANGYIKIRDVSGNEGWLSGEYITYAASPKADLSALKQQLGQQEMIAAQFEQERQNLQQAVVAAETERDNAKKEAELAKQTAAQLTARLADENPDLMQNKMVIGGGILAVGLFLGLILPAITPKRRRNDRWM